MINNNRYFTKVERIPENRGLLGFHRQLHEIHRLRVAEKPGLTALSQQFYFDVEYSGFLHLVLMMVPIICRECRNHFVNLTGTYNFTSLPVFQVNQNNPEVAEQVSKITTRRRYGTKNFVSSCRNDCP